MSLTKRKQQIPIMNGDTKIENSPNVNKFSRFIMNVFKPKGVVRAKSRANEINFSKIDDNRGSSTLPKCKSTKRLSCAEIPSTSLASGNEDCVQQLTKSVNEIAIKNDEQSTGCETSQCLGEILSSDDSDNAEHGRDNTNQSYEHSENSDLNEVTENLHHNDIEVTDRRSSIASESCSESNIPTEDYVHNSADISETDNSASSVTSSQEYCCDDDSHQRLDNTDFDKKLKFTQSCHSSFVQHTHGSEFSTTSKSDTIEDPNGLKWITSRTCPRSSLAPPNLLGRYLPRAPPRDTLRFTSAEINECPPTEYFVMWSNGERSVAILNQEPGFDCKAPLTIQFGGNWCDDESKTLTQASVVIVRRYSMMRKTYGADRTFLRRGTLITDIVRDGFPEGCAFAVEWALVTMPRVFRSLGCISGLDLLRTPYGILYYTQVYDVQQQVRVDVPDDLWPLYSREEPYEGQPVVLNWVFIEGPYATMQGRDVEVLFPQWASKDYNTLCMDHDSYRLGWLDTKLI